MADDPVELDLTVRWPSRRGGSLDVRITTPRGATLGDLLPLIGDLVGHTPAQVTCAGIAVPADTRWGSAPLLHGATLVLDSPVRAVDRATSPIDVVAVSGPDAGRRSDLSPQGVVVGRLTGGGLDLHDDRLSRRHAHIASDDHGFRVTDLGSTNGTRCGTADLGSGGSHALDWPDLVSVGSTLLQLRRSGGPHAPVTERGDGRLVVNRAPRTRAPDVTATVHAPATPTPPRRGRIPWVAAALPLPFAGLLAVFFGPHMLAFGLLSPLMLVGTVLGDRWSGRRDHARDLATHEAELAVRRGEFDALRDLERQQRWHDAPDPAMIIDIASGPGTRLWERRAEAPDVGRVRLGVGSLPSRTGWEPAHSDPTTRPTGGAGTQHPPLFGLPVEADLRAAGGLGIAGTNPHVDALMRNVLGQMTVLHSPRDLHLIVHDDPSDTSGAMSWARWLPHTTAHGDLATCLDAVRDVVTEREVHASSRGAHGPTHGARAQPHVVVVLPRSEVGLIELADLLERGRGHGVWCLVGAGSVAMLPASCHAVVDLGDGSARLDIDGAAPVPAFIPDLVSWGWAERIGRALAPLVDGSDADTVPTRVDLLDLVPWLEPRGTLSADALADHWSTRPARPIARLGRVAGDDWVIDLADDGPHLLVGGTTGSGKSELLRTLVTSLALECSPEDLTFVLVDYKGGSAFGECAELPHTVGLVTNLDDGLAHRALVSLRAEITRREALLAAAGARDFEDFRRTSTGLARLVIVIDEFRLLADELPDFVDGIVSLAAVGRSLGVHLVLATQRPAGAVTPDIAANVNLRIAMRVRDTADSVDVIGTADAAHIAPDRPGRGFARGGGPDLVEFQAARVGAGGEASSLRIMALTPSGHPTGAQRQHAGVETGRQTPDLAQIAAAAVQAAHRLAVVPPHRPWVPALPEHVTTGHPGEVGLLDLPGEQRQTTFAHAGGSGHWLLAGGPRSGRTTCLRTILASHVADPSSDVEVHAIDPTGALADLEALPHVGAVVGADDGSRVQRLLDHLRTRSESPIDRPPVLLLIDGWDRLDADADVAVGGLREELLDLLRSGDTGLRAVITGDRSTLTGRLGSVVSETFLLPLADAADAAYAGLSRRDLPSSRAPGRGLRLSDRVEVQFARRNFADECRAPARPVGAPAPFTVPRLPRTVDHAELLSGPPWLESSSARVTDLVLGVSAHTGAAVALEVGRHGRRILVAGHPRSGRTTTLLTIGASALAAGRAVAVLESPGGALGRELVGATVVDPWHIDALVAARRAAPDLVVLVDDADRLDGTPAEPVLTEIVSLLDRDGGLMVVATTPAAVATTFRGLVHRVAQAQSGVLLGPRTPSDGEPFGIRAPRGLLAVPGRGLLVSGRQPEEVQVALVQPARNIDDGESVGSGGVPAARQPRRPEFMRQGP